MPFITGGLLAFAIANTIAGFGMPFSLNAQVITVAVPWLFWLVAMSSSHVWTKTLAPRVRGAVSALQAGVVGVLWVLLTVLGSSNVSVIIIILQIVSVVAFVGASFLNAFFVEKEGGTAEPEEMRKKPSVKKKTSDTDVSETAPEGKKNSTKTGARQSTTTPVKKPVSARKPSTTKTAVRKPSTTAGKKPAGSNNKKPAGSKRDSE